MFSRPVDLDPRKSHRRSQRLWRKIDECVQQDAWFAKSTRPQMGACFEGFGLSHFGRTNMPSVARKVNALHDVSEEVCHRDCRIGWLVKDLLQHISTWFAAPCIHYQKVTNRRSYSTFALKHSEQIVVEKAKGVRVTSLLPCFQVEVRSTSRSGRTTWVSHSVYRSKSTCVLQYFRSWVRHLGQKALQSTMPERFHECMFVLFVCFPCRWL
jgi:hypothetical protein